MTSLNPTYNNIMSNPTQRTTILNRWLELNDKMEKALIDIEDPEKSVEEAEQILESCNQEMAKIEDQNPWMAEIIQVIDGK